MDADANIANIIMLASSFGVIYAVWVLFDGAKEIFWELYARWDRKRKGGK